MSDVALSGAPIKAPKTELSCTPNDGLLPITGNLPVLVYVRITLDTDGGKTAEFSSNGTDWYNKGIYWECGDEYALFITFVLTTTGIELVPRAVNPNVWFSPLGTTGNDSTQLGCVYPVEGILHFRVRVPPSTTTEQDEYIDPKMVITPITAQSTGPKPHGRS